MNIEDLSYLGYELKSSTFIQNNEPRSKCFYKYELDFDSVKFIARIHRDDGYSHDELVLSYITSVDGYECENEEHAVFELTFEFSIMFGVNNNVAWSEKDVVNHDWFFENFASVASKLICDSVLTHTPMRGTFIPSYRMLN